LRPRLLFALLGLGLAAAAPANAQTADDPYEKLNRTLYARAIEVDQRFFLPASRLYQSLAPGVLGLAIHNFVTNLSEPVVVANDILQVRPRRAADDFARLVTNTTFGVGGIIDVAKRQGLPHRDNDFGVTLGRLGVKPGPYLFLLFLGPSDLRDAIGMGVDAVANPLNWVTFPGRIPLLVTTTVVGALDARLRAQGDLEAEIGGATDPYATIRSDYLQSREAMIRGEEAAPVLPPLDDPASEPAGGAAPSASQSPSAAVSPPSATLVAADAVATAPAVAAADDPADLAMATAQPCDRDPAAATRLAGL
jgi:phospholipid-binding lipoprotein MlaA